MRCDGLDIDGFFFSFGVYVFFGLYGRVFLDIVSLHGVEKTK